MRRNMRLSILWVFVSFALPLVAQDTPIGAPGIQLGTEETPAAAASTDALRKAAQNPIASLIGVPVQNNTNFNAGLIIAIKTY
jgi:hypothetical protein